MYASTTHNAFLIAYLERDEAKNIKLPDLVNSVDVNNTILEFLSSLKENWENYIHFNNVKNI